MGCCPTSHQIAAILSGLYGLVSIGGGIYGYIVTSSEGNPSYASLAAGCGAGVVLLLCMAGVGRKPVLALVGSLIVALALLGRFASKVVGNLGTLGEFVNTSAGMTAVVMTLGGLLVMLGSAAALWSRRCSSCA